MIESQYDTEAHNNTKLKFDFGEIWLGDDEIIRLIYYPNTEIDIDKAREIGFVIAEISRGKKRPMYVDSRNVKNANLEARNHLASTEVTRWTSAIGSYNNPITYILAGLYIKINKPPYPIKVFKSEEKAIEWLKGFL